MTSNYNYDDIKDIISTINNNVEELDRQLYYYVHNLNERIKELECLYQVVNLTTRENYPLEKTLEQIVKIIPSYWHYPEITCARIIFQGKEFTSPGFKESKWSLYSDIIIKGKKTGILEVFYLQEKPELHEGPFLKEERTLIDSITKHLVNVVKRKQYKKALQESEENLSITLQSIGDGVISTDVSGHVSFMNPQAENLTGYSTKEAQNRPLHEVFYIVNGKTNKVVENPVQKVLKTGKQKNLANNTVLISSDGTRYQIADSAAPIFDNKNNIRGVVLVFSDITEKYENQEKLRRSEEKYRALVNQSAEMIFLHDLKGNIKEVNNKAIKKTGYSKEELLQMTVFDLHPDIPEATDREDILCQWESMSPKGTSLTLETRHLHKDGAIYPVEVTTNKVVFGKNTYMLALVRDITERKHYEEQLRHMSLHDQLTGLYNRAYMEEEVRRQELKNEIPVSIVMVDVNGLKLINDSYGPKEGDKLLKDTANILRTTCRKEDIIARWGGDEFVIFMPNTDKSTAEKIADKVKKESNNFNQKAVLPLNITLGTATKDNFEKQLHQIFKEAEDFMYKNKLIENDSTRSDIISTLLGTLKEKSDETEEHARRMTELGLKLGKVLGLSDTDMHKLSLLANMHDIGKVVISEEILKKPGKLTEKEWEIIKEHPKTGQRIARTSQSLAHISEEIAAHHERWDGKGYPYGLKGEEIPCLSRIIAIIDAFDVITNGRTYKDPQSRKKALNEIKRCAGSQFDPHLAKEFIELLQ